MIAELIILGGSALALVGFLIYICVKSGTSFKLNLFQLKNTYKTIKKDG